MQKTLLDDMKAAMKSGEKAKLSSIRMLRAALKDKEIEIGHALDQAQELTVVTRLVKQRHDAAKQYLEAGRQDLQEKELAEVVFFQAYLPEPLSDAELTSILDQAISDSGATSMRDMGKVMALVKAQAEGRADMGKVSAVIKARLG
ncbi:MAG: GatB/YqeY domain-containing protein [Mariprofundus sp.]|nr:GatB/YqeY domain-containing protein [Mariprofundus sp.]